MAQNPICLDHVLTMHPCESTTTACCKGNVPALPTVGKPLIWIHGIVGAAKMTDYARSTISVREKGSSGSSSKITAQALRLTESSRTREAIVIIFTRLPQQDATHPAMRKAFPRGIPHLKVTKEAATMHHCEVFQAGRQWVARETADPAGVSVTR